MAQYARPDSDITRTGIQSGTCADIDESAYNDSDYIYGYNNTAVDYVCSLTNITDPGVNTGHVLRIRMGKVDDGVPDSGGSGINAVVTLWQGSTEITDVYTRINQALGSWTTYTTTLTEAQAGSITDYSDLRIRVEANASGGAEANKRGAAITWAEFEVPDAGGSSVEESTTLARYQASSSADTLGVDESAALARAQASSSLETLNVDHSISLPRLAAVSIEESTAGGQVEESLTLDRIVRCAEPLAAATNEAASAAIHNSISAAEEVIVNDSLDLTRTLGTAPAENITGEETRILARTSGITAEDEGGAVTEIVSLARSAAESQLSSVNATGDVTAGRLSGITAQDDSGAVSENVTLSKAAAQSQQSSIITTGAAAASRSSAISAQGDSGAVSEAVSLSKSSLLAGTEAPRLSNQVPLGKITTAPAASDVNVISLLGLARIMTIWAAGIRAGEEDHTCAPAERLFAVLADPRALLIDSEDRTTIIFADQRTCVIEDNRIHQIPAEERTYKVKR